MEMDDGESREARGSTSSVTCEGIDENGEAGETMCFRRRGPTSFFRAKTPSIVFVILFVTCGASSKLLLPPAALCPFAFSFSFHKQKQKQKLYFKSKTIMGNAHIQYSIMCWTKLSLVEDIFEKPKTKKENHYHL